MALTFGNMDQQVQQQADAFSDNPAALQQRYQQSQQLLDLLALQKIKSDKEAAAREMQMQMEQRPQTIAQQREAEVMGLTKDELAKQISGIMAQRQAVEQSNIKRAASGQPPRQRMAMAPPMRNPRTEGVASQRADNMVNMAQGGIVGFEPGGRVEGGVTDEQLKAMGITPSAWAVMSERDKALAIRILMPLSPSLLLVWRLRHLEICTLPVPVPVPPLLPLLLSLLLLQVLLRCLELLHLHLVIIGRKKRRLRILIGSKGYLEN
jgi:hypothetical protein